MVVERVSGLTLTDFIQENIAEPLGLNYTFPQRVSTDQNGKNHVGATPTDSINELVRAVFIQLHLIM